MADVRNIFKYVYLLYTKYKGIKLNDNWDELTKEANELYEKYKSQIAKEMIVSIMEQLEREAREMK